MPSCSSTTSGVEITNLCNVPKEETIPALTRPPLGDNSSQKKSNARREAVRKAMASGLKRVRDLGEGVQGRTVTVDASADSYATVAANPADHNVTRKARSAPPLDPRLKMPAPGAWKPNPSLFSPETALHAQYASAGPLVAVREVIAHRFSQPRNSACVPFQTRDGCSAWPSSALILAPAATTRPSART